MFGVATAHGLSPVTPGSASVHAWILPGDSKRYDAACKETELATDNSNGISELCINEAGIRGAYHTSIVHRFFRPRSSRELIMLRHMTTMLGQPCYYSKNVNIWQCVDCLGRSRTRGRMETHYRHKKAKGICLPLADEASIAVQYEGNQPLVTNAAQNVAGGHGTTQASPPRTPCPATPSGVCRSPQSQSCGVCFPYSAMAKSCDDLSPLPGSLRLHNTDSSGSGRAGTLAYYHH